MAPSSTCLHIKVPTSFPGSFVFPQEGVVEERPWFRLVTCLGDKIIFMGGVPIFQKIVATSICHIQNETRTIAMFFGSLHSSISRSSYWNVNLKPKQVKCLEAVYSGRDVIAVLPTGYGKSIIFHLLPALLFEKVNSAPPSQSSYTIHPTVIVVSPLNSLIRDQIRRSTQGNLTSAILNVQRNDNSDEVELDLAHSNSSLLRDGRYDLVFTHPEAVLSCKEGLELFQSTPYQRSVQAVVIDEAHCILEW